MSSSTWKEKIELEFRQGQVAREKGNQGQARVCARRAAGIAIGEFLQRQNLPDPGPSALDRLNYLAVLPGMTPRIREICGHLTLRVNEDFALPIKVDLLEETRQLVAELLGSGDISV